MTTPRDGTQASNLPHLRNGSLLFREVDLVVEVIVAVPELLSVDVISHAKQQRLRLKIGLVSQLDVEIETVVTVAELLLSHVVVVLCNDFRRGLPVVERKSGDDVLLERDVSTSDRANERLVVRGQEDSLDTNWQCASLITFLGEVGKLNVPLCLAGNVVSRFRVEGILYVAIVDLHWRGTSADSNRSINLEEVTNLLNVIVEMYGLGESGCPRHTRRTTSGRRPEGRLDQLSRFLPDERRFHPQLVVIILAVVRRLRRVTDGRGEGGKLNLA